MMLPPADRGNPRDTGDNGGPKASSPNALEENGVLPFVEPECGREAVECPQRLFVCSATGVLANVEEDVNECVAILPRSTEVAAVVSVAPNGTASFKKKIDVLSNATAKPFHPARHGVGVISLQEEVKMIALNGEVENAKPVGGREPNLGAKHNVKPLCPKPSQSTNST